MEIKVDYNKGVILGEKMYNPSGYLLTDDTYTGYEKIGTELSDFWYSKMLIEKTAVEQDQFLTKTVKYEKILFNQDLSDEIFQ